MAAGGILRELGRAALALAVAILIAPQKSQTAKAADTISQVIVTDTAIMPQDAHIPMGATVRWRNAGGSRHHLSSDTNEWAPFDLAPGAQHDVAFRRSGRFPYSVDHSLKGVVVVEAGGAGSASQTGPEQHKPRVLHFSARLTVSASHHSDTEGTEPSLDDTKVEWSGLWPDIAIEVDLRDETRFDNGRLGAAKGEILVTAGYHQIVPGPNSHDCTGDLTSKTYPALLQLYGSTRSGYARFEMNAFPNQSGGAGPTDPEFVKEQHDRCNNAVPVWPGRREFPVETDLTFEVDPLDIAVKVYRRNVPVPFPPLDLVLGHQAFVFDTGDQRQVKDGKRSTWRAEWHARVEFSPL